MIFGAQRPRGGCRGTSRAGCVRRDVSCFYILTYLPLRHRQQMAKDRAAAAAATQAAGKDASSSQGQGGQAAHK